MIKSNPYYNYYNYKNEPYTTKFKAMISAFQDQGYQNLDNCSLINWSAPYFDIALNSVDTTIEPIDSIQNLYKKRAESLRNKYDYLILHYSGGADSHNILETFMLNGIHLDEICIHHYSPDENPTENIYKLCDHLDEVPKIAIPMAKFFISEYSPTTKLTVKTNVRDSIINFWKTLDAKDSFNKNLDIWLMRDPVRVYNIQSYSDTPNFWKKLKERKKVAHIFGLEKPSLYVDEKGIYSTISDSILNARQDSTCQYDTDVLPYNVEYFYIHPEHMDLYIKASHLLYNKISNISNLLLPIKKIDSDFFNFQSDTELENSIYKIKKFNDAGRDYQNLCAKVLYNQKYKLPFTSLKVGDYLFDGGFYRLPQNIKKIYHQTTSLGLVSNSPYNIDYVLYSFITGNDSASSNFFKFLDLICYFFPNQSKYDILSTLRKNFSKKIYIKKVFK